MPEAIVWNTAITGNGTNQALASFEAFASQLRPQVALLGFFMNDFFDNEMPIDRWSRLQNASGELVTAPRYVLDRLRVPVKVDPVTTHSHFMNNNYRVPWLSESERIMGSTRLGTLLLRLLDQLGKFDLFSAEVNQLKLTRQYLTELRDAASAGSTTLLVLLIPDSTDIDAPSKNYRTSVQFMQELQIPYMEVTGLLEPVDDYAELGDPHCNNSGHQ